jgi:hypothetical protein
METARQLLKEEEKGVRNHCLISRLVPGTAFSLVGMLTRLTFRSSGVETS